MPTRIHLEDLQRAWEARDPELPRLIETLSQQPDEPPQTPIRQGAMTFQRFLAEIQSTPFHRKPKEEQAHYRIEQMKALEAPDAEVPLPERLRLHDLIFKLWQENDLFARTCLLKVIATVKLTYGPWRALKRIFKEAEARGDTEVYGALAARFDTAYAAWQSDIRRGTLAYLCRRAWRYLRRLGIALPAAYPDACVDVLAHYPEGVNWDRTWVANHIFYHETRQYTRSSFRLSPRPTNLLKHRAYAELWRRTPRPLFALLERAQSERVRAYAVSALKADFRSSLREVEPAWVARLVHVGSATIDSFVVWILTNVPRFEQAAFRTLGLHDAVLRLFDSPSSEAQSYAADYARTHARDLPVGELVRLANSENEDVRGLAFDLLQARDPRKDVGLEAWGALLETEYGHELAARVLRKSFGARELTPDWFKDRLFSENETAFEFVKDLLPQVHPYQKLGPGFFADLIDRIDDPASYTARRVAGYALGELARFDLNTLDRDFLQRLLVHPLTTHRARAWINEGRLKTQSLPVEFFKALAYHPDWEANPWIADLKQSNRVWARQLEFNEELADQVLGWLKDVRRFAPADIGLDWLMQLVMRSEPRYHDFAVETLIKSFVPADFAPRAPSPPPLSPEAGERGEEKAPLSPLGGRGVGGEGGRPEVNLGGRSFLFTGKMATMPRKEAEERVRKAGGTVFSAVSSKLHYLVIGDEGSPLYGHGKKGAKQLKAEELNAQGANISIISETAFLRMLSGERQTYSADATLAGCERLWEMVVAPGPGDAPLARFAMKYIRRHHPEICLDETDRPVDPGAEIPAAFLTFERVKPLFAESRKPLRDFALGLAKWEFARWSPPAEELIKLAELPYGEVRKFVAEALLADEAPEHRRYRIDPAVLSPAAVYSFCESPDEQTRLLGMELIKRSPRLQVPEELFRLTESPDRKVRGFVIRALWSLYRDRGIKADWKPYVPPPSALAAGKKKEDRGPGAPHRPEQLPANLPTLAEFLRRVLFEIPPGRTEPSKDGTEGITIRLKPLPARKAKLALVEMMRDLALEDVDFARGVLPLLEEFMVSRGQSEHAACLVAVTRIRKKHPDLQPAVTEAVP
ncbi:MAG TPA: BRCT domain-containing protein [Gemmataceae bacterium]|nr:BRCT domain-containing protein [Gemmataceae bacterium]